MKTVVLFILGILMDTHTSAYAKDYTDNCFRKHIEESIVVNRTRKNEYSALTNGSSNRIFTHLIGLETLTIPIAMYFDFKASPFKKKGMELFCHEFVSMNRAPEFDPKRRINPQHDFPEKTFGSYKEKMKDALSRNDDRAMRKLSMQEIRNLEKYPHYYCMTRHLIESIYRMAYFISVREEEARTLGVSSPRAILMNVISAHLFGLHEAVKIDKWSRPIQENGIPILCSELPNAIHDLNIGDD